ncbi:hypothetical protein NBRC116601_07400 [Cognatishimia sp. WU-CL00825]|uniref:DUF4198 domain-containing protein n=1 Tax=Cognatishimia sp. WU-CL00825 TaxID=3127658 RepID=UPI0031081D53
MRLLCFLLLSLSVAKSALAHEFWIDAQKYQVETNEAVIADLRNGQNFQGGALSWFDRRIATSLALMGDQRHVMTGRAGDLPALSYQPEDTGLLRLMHQTTMDTITYREAEKFEAFISHKDLDPAALEAPIYPLVEGYTRFVKSLVAVGDGHGSDAFGGLEFEFVALANPYSDALPEGLPVQLWYQSAPHPNAQIEVFSKNSSGEVLVTQLRTNAKGLVNIPLQSGYQYLLDSVILRRPTEALQVEKDIAWESLWAALTFARP